MPEDSQQITDGNSLLRAAKRMKKEVNGRAWFRGQAKAEWKLSPKVHGREGAPEYDEVFLTNHFRLRAKSRYANCPTHDDVTSWLTLMRHYGLPTRLLDWTESILVATFFCVEDQKHDSCDGAVWVIDPVYLNKSTMGSPTLLQINSRNPKFLAHRAFNDDYDYKEGETIEENIYAVLAADIDLRMLMQQATFTIHGADTRPLNETLLIHGDIWKLIVPKDVKARLREDLECFGIRRSNLFPDLEQLASELEGEPPYENPVSS